VFLTQPLREGASSRTDGENAMKNEIGAVLAANAVAATAPAAPPPPVKAPGAPGPEAPNLRLIIEEDQATGEFIYTTLDRSTGEVILQLPRKEVLKNVMTGTYSAGDVIKARA
jgi:flagellar protein FlaG